MSAADSLKGERDAGIAPERLRTHAATAPNRVALRYGSGHFTYGQLEREVGRIAGGLAELGVRAGDRVAVMLPNRPEYFVAAHAVWRLGAVLVPVNALFRSEELAFVLIDSGASVLVTSPEGANMIASERDGAPELACVIVVGGSAGGGLAYSDVAAAAPINEVAIESPEQLAVIAYTSGTTGQPKGAMLDHGHYRDAWYFICDELDLDAEDNVLQGLPAFHMNASAMGVFLALWLGSTAVLLERMTTEALSRGLRLTQISVFAPVPAVLTDLLEADAALAQDLGEIRYAIVGSAPMSPILRHEVEARFGLHIVQAYGMTEATFIALDPIGRTIPSGAVGLPVDITKVVLVDDAGRPVPPGDAGEICLLPPDRPGRSGVAFRPIHGYWHDSAATARAMSGNMFHTGDIGRLDDEGFLYLVDRKKDMIIRGGNNVYPAELERILCGDERVSQAIVIGIPHGRLGEVPKAFVVLSDKNASLAELRDAANARMSKFKRIEMIESIDAADVPRNAMGKILKRELVARALAEAKRSPTRVD
jgi:long-chain acyl-CoA synthetase